MLKVLSLQNSSSTEKKPKRKFRPFVWVLAQAERPRLNLLMGRFPGGDGRLVALALSADPFLTFTHNLFGAVAKFVRLLIQIIHSFIGAAANVLSHLFAGPRRQ